MPEYLAPGVYIEEIEIGGKPIEGVSTTTAGFIGETDRGPAMPRLITGLEQFLRLYGGFLPDSYLPYAVEGFFSNGGKRCFICRIVGKNSSPAILEIPIHSDKSEKPKKSSKAAASESLKETAPDEESPQGNSGQAFSIKTIGHGAWGNRVAIKIEQASLSALNPKLFKLIVIY